MAIDFYFDVISPYAYLAWKRVPSLLPNVQMTPRPVLLGPILAHHGQLGPAEIVPKRAFTIRDTLRRAAEAKLTLVWPARHPFKPVLAMKALLAIAEDERARAIDALFDAAWGEGRDLEDRAIVHEALARADFDAAAILAKADDKAASLALRAANADALARGVFGVPTLIDEEGELFFGDDQVERVAKKRAGRDAFTAEHRATAQVVEARSGGVDRSAKKSGAVVVDAPARAPKIDVDAALGAHVLSVYTRAPFLATLGVEVVRIGAGETEIALVLRPDLLQQDGFAHAAVVAALADHNAGSCAASAAPVGSQILTIEFKINLLRPAKGPRLVCRSRVLKAGKTISVVESEVFDQRGEGGDLLVAKATVTLAVRAS